jgi:hypothetical membrane protein
MLRKTLLVCGILSSLLYVGTDVLAAVRYADYHSFTSRAISELGAIGAPTKQLVDPLFLTYSVLLLAFGLGVWGSPGRKRSLRLVAASLIGVAAVGMVTGLFFPMHLRGTADVTGDAPHIVLTAVTVLLILSAVACGSALDGTLFRRYSFLTILVLLVAGALAGVEGARLALQQPTPWLGLTERINIGAYLLWVVILAVILLRTKGDRRTAILGEPGEVGAVKGLIY